MQQADQILGGGGPDMQGIVKGLIIIVAVAIDYLRGSR
jgi:hypothetical protein